MAIQLNNDVAATLAAKRTYEKSAWTATVDDFLKMTTTVEVDGEDVTTPVNAIGRIEADYPGVKPAHVAHCLKRDIKERKLESKVAVVTDKDYGICLSRVA